MLEIDILGCGSSLGVPVLACDCSVCRSDSVYNKRCRCAIIISSLGVNKTFSDTDSAVILVDCGFDVREQLLRSGITDLDAVILTHDHADHVSGIDELRVFGYNSGKPLPVFVHEEVAPFIIDRCRYLLDNGRLQINPVRWFQELGIKGVRVQLFPQIHGAIKSFGIRVGDFVYSSDISEIADGASWYLQDVKVWVVDCIDYDSTTGHAGFKKVLEWREKYKPKKIYLTNMSHKIDYHKITAELLRDSRYDIEPLYDGFKIKL